MKKLSLIFVGLLSINVYPKECPNYSMPMCGGDEVVSLKNPKDQCSQPICVKKRSCPSYAKPFCGPNETVGLTNPKDQCSEPVCIKVEKPKSDAGAAH